MYLDTRSMYCCILWHSSLSGPCFMLTTTNKSNQRAQSPQALRAPSWSLVAPWLQSHHMSMLQCRSYRAACTALRPSEPVGIHNMLMMVIINIRIPHPHPNTQNRDKPHHPTTPPTIAKGEFHFSVKPQTLACPNPHQHQIPSQELPHPNQVASTHLPKHPPKHNNRTPTHQPRNLCQRGIPKTICTVNSGA